MKEVLQNFLKDETITADNFANKFSETNTSPINFAIELEDYIPTANNSEIENKNKTDMITSAFYQVVIDFFKRNIGIVTDIDNNDKYKYSKLSNIMKESKVLFDKYFELYLADITYNEPSIITDDVEKEIDNIYEELVKTTHKKIIAINNEDNGIKTLILKRNYHKTTAEQIRINLKSKYEAEGNINEYYNVINNNIEYNNHFRFYNICDTGIYSFVQFKNFEESVANNFNKELSEEYFRVYVKRRIHQFTFSKDEMFQYIIKPTYDFESNANLTMEIFQDIGHFIPTHKKNMKQLLLAFKTLCEYEYNKVIYEISNIFADSEDKGASLYEVFAKANEIKKQTENVCSEYQHAYSRENISYDAKHYLEHKYFNEIKEMFDFKTQSLFPETKEYYKKIEYFREKLHSLNSDIFSRQNDDERIKYFEEIKIIKNKILKYLQNNN